MSQVEAVLQSDLSFQADFTEPAFILFKDRTGLYDLLYEQLSTRFGLETSGMQPQLVSGNLAEVQLTCLLPGFSTSIRISAEKIEIVCGNSLGVKQQDFAEIGLSALNAVAQYITVPHKSYSLSVNFHATLAGMSTQDYLARFTPVTPQTLGPRIGAGVVFYYGAEAERLSSFVTLDFSGLHRGALFVRMHGVWDAGKVAVTDFPSVADSYIRKIVAAVNLILPEASAS